MILFLRTPIRLYLNILNKTEKMCLRINQVTQRLSEKKSKIIMFSRIVNHRVESLPVRSSGKVENPQKLVFELAEINFLMTCHWLNQGRTSRGDGGMHPFNIF